MQMQEEVRLETDNKRQVGRAEKDFLRLVLAGLQLNLNATNDACWEWPEEWPNEWGEKPDGFLVLRNDNKYGLLVLLARNGELQNTELAHRAMYKYLSTDIEELPNEWKEKFKDAELATESTGSEDQVRHTCNNSLCVRPSHLALDIGGDGLNALDRSIKEHEGLTISSKANKLREAVVGDWQNGEYRIRILANKQAIKQWEVHRILKEAGISIDEFLKTMRSTGIQSNAEVEGRLLLAAKEQKMSVKSSGL